MDMKEIERSVREFVTENFILANGEIELQNDDSFLEKGLIDSMGVLELVDFIESRYSFAISDDDLLPENLDSINRITAFVARNLSEQSS